MLESILSFLLDFSIDVSILPISFCFRSSWRISLSFLNSGMDAIITARIVVTIIVTIWDVQIVMPGNIACLDNS